MSSLTPTRRPPTLESLNPDDLHHLGRYGFDPDLFASWQEGVRSGELSAARNTLQSTILAPEPQTIQGLPKKGTPEAEELEALGREAISRGELGAVILNGGMATRFGGAVKGAVKVLGERSFLGLKLEDIQRTEQACGGEIQVFLMNSFATESSTKRHLEENDHFGFTPERIRAYNQFVSLRMTPAGKIFKTQDGGISPYGPGHGDFAPAFRDSQCLQGFLDAGGRYVFATNVDNLGACVSPRILGHHIRSQADATVEVAPKWPGDVGGAPYIVDNKLQLVEQIRYAKDFDPDIVDVFNTNTFTFTASALDREFNLGWYFVKKTIEDQAAVQIERLIGELTRFLDCNFIKVKRTGTENRFLPIKTPEDLDAARDEIAELYD